jgi:short-subunit dehydrogenase
VLLFSEAIAEELKDTGVTVTAFCPGPTKSGFQDKAVMQKSGLVANRKLPGAEEVGIEGYRAMMRGTRVYVPGLVNKLLVQSVRLGPRNLNAAVVAWLSKPVAP